MSIKRIVIIGLGSIGQRHLRLSRQIFPDAEIRVLRHQQNYLVPQYANGILRSIEEAIKFAPQIGVISNPAPFHLSYAQALVETGVHLLIEKPLSSSMLGVKEFLDICSQQRSIVLIGYNLRFLTSLQKFKYYFEQGVVGELLSVRCEIGQYLPSWRPDQDYRKGVSARRKLGGGALLELSHEFDYLRWIFGEILWVRATISKQSSLDIDVEDTAHITVGLESSRKKKIIIGTVNLDFIRHDITRYCFAIGEKGTLRWNGITGEVSFFKIGANQWDEICPPANHRDQSYLAEWEHFISCITDQKRPLISVNDGSEVLKIIEAVRLSAPTGHEVAIKKSES